MPHLIRYVVLSILAFMFTAVFCSPMSKGEHGVSLVVHDLEEDIRRWSATVGTINLRDLVTRAKAVRALSTVERVCVEAEQSPHIKAKVLQDRFFGWQEVYYDIVLQLYEVLGVKYDPIELKPIYDCLHDDYVDIHRIFRAILLHPLWNDFAGPGSSDLTYARHLKGSMCVFYAFVRVEPEHNTRLLKCFGDPVKDAISRLDSLLPSAFKLDAETKCADTPLADKWVPLSRQESSQQQPHQPQQPQGPQPQPNQKQTFLQWLASTRPVKWLLNFLKKFLPSSSDKN